MGDVLWRKSGRKCATEENYFCQVKRKRKQRAFSTVKMTIEKFSKLIIEIIRCKKRFMSNATKLIEK